MNRRPVAVVISAIMLAIGGAFQLLSAVLSGFAAVVAPRMPVAAQPGVAPPSPAFLMAVMLFSAVFYLALAGWAGTTAVGLFRMRRWARISMIVIGAALIFVGLFGAVSMVAVQFAAAAMPVPPNTDPHIIRLVFMVAGLFALSLAVIGIWWVVYFALRRTRNAFLFAESNRTSAHAGVPEEAVRYGPTTDFETPGAGAIVAHPSIQHGTYVTENQTGRTGRPVSITVIAVLLLVGSVSALFQMLSPFPLFLFGALLSGWPAHIVMLIWCAVNGVAGLGLLKREKPAWVLAFGVFCLPALNGLAMLLPGARLRFANYMATLMERSSFGLPQPQLPAPFITACAIMGVVFALLGSGLVLTLLWRAKWAFEPTGEAQAAR